jgi:mono/diheme cytochrome c family protein
VTAERSPATSQRRHHRWLHVLLVVSGAVGLVVVGALVAAGVLLSGSVSTAATKQHFLITHRLLDIGLRFSVRRAASEEPAPLLDDPALVERGLACYRRHCEQCHGGPGRAPGAAARGMLPIPSNLVQAGRDWPAQWLHYVTRKGVRMTGMPAWEYRISDHDLWATVAFLKTLPTLTARDYAARIDASTDVECPDRQDLPEPPDDPGPTLLRQYACDSCHVIEGVVGPQIHVGPPLRDWPRRGYIAGVLPNTPANLERWIRDPQQVSPGTLMPDLDVPPAHARAMAEFLFLQAPLEQPAKHPEHAAEHTRSGEHTGSGEHTEPAQRSEPAEHAE